MLCVTEAVETGPGMYDKTVNIIQLSVSKRDVRLLTTLYLHLTPLSKCLLPTEISMLINFVNLLNLTISLFNEFFLNPYLTERRGISQSAAYFFGFSITGNTFFKKYIQF